MAQQTINVGTAPNDGTGTPLRTAFQYTNSNFSELYTAVGPSGNNIVVPGTATITGDLTVDTSTLKVDSANNCVGIGTTTPNSYPVAPNLVVQTATNGGITIRTGTLNYGGLYFADGTGADAYRGYVQYNHDYLGIVDTLLFGVAGAQRYSIDATGVSTWYVGGSTAMTLNSTGLGVGGSPASKLYVYGANVSGIGQFRIDCPAAGVAQQTFAINGVSQGQVYADGTQFVIGSATSTPLLLRTANTVAVTIDASQNVGIGITSPSYLLHTSVPTGGDRNMVRFQVSGASSGLTITWNNGTQKMRVNFGDLPTSSAGLPANTLWVDTAAGNTLKLA